MMEQITYVVLGTIGITIFDIFLTLLSNKLNTDKFLAAIILSISGLIAYSIYPIVSIKVASIGGGINGVIAGGIIGFYNSTIGILIAKKISKTNEIKWKTSSKGVFYGIVIAVIISMISIYMYNQFK